MAFLVLHDPYEWFDPEKGRQGSLVHTSQIFAREEKPQPKITWQDVWSQLDKEAADAHQRTR